MQIIEYWGMYREGVYNTREGVIHQATIRRNGEFGAETLHAREENNEMSKKRAYSEKYLERKLVERIKAHGGLCLKFASITETGYPDRLCLMPHGRTLWVELKTTGRKPTKLQEIRHQELRERGFAVYVVDDMITLEQAVRDATA